MTSGDFLHAGHPSHGVVAAVIHRSGTLAAMRCRAIYPNEGCLDAAVLFLTGIPIAISDHSGFPDVQLFVC
jgi:hypothetical protein